MTQHEAMRNGQSINQPIKLSPASEEEEAARAIRNSLEYLYGLALESKLNLTAHLIGVAVESLRDVRNGSGLANSIPNGKHVNLGGIGR